MSKPSEHAARARKYQAEADLLMTTAEWGGMNPNEAKVNCLSAIESRLAALTEAVLATVPYPILARSEENPPA